MKAKVGDNCKFCLRPITQEIVDLKRHLKSENAKASARKAFANGSRRGPPRKRNDEKIIALRKQGLSMRAICLEAKCSLSSVQASLKEAGLKIKPVPGKRGCGKPNCWCRNTGYPPEGMK